MNLKHKNIKKQALLGGAFLFVFLFSPKPIKTGSSETVNTTKNLMTYALDSNKLINTNTDTIKPVMSEKTAKFGKKDFKPIAKQNYKFADTVFVPQTNYLLEDAIKDYSNYSVKNQGKKLTFLCNDSIICVRENGTLPWRNNNPGALKYGEFTKTYGAIGKGNRGFAVFPTREMGVRALKALLQTDYYKKLSVGRAIEVFAPSHENNTEKYKRRVKGLAGVSLSKKLRDLSNQEFERVVDAIITLEGSINGKETMYSGGKPVLNKDTVSSPTLDTLILQQNVKTL